MSENPPRDVWAEVRVEKPEIYFLRFTLESHEGLCVPTTMPGGEGLVRLNTSADLREELQLVLEGLSREMKIEILSWGEG